MADPQDLNVARIEASSETDYKCSRCGVTFPVEEGEAQGRCPYCGNVCTPQSCRVLGGSKEGF